MVVTAMRVMFASGRMMHNMMCPFMKTLQPHHRYPEDQPKKAEKAGYYRLLTIHGGKVKYILMCLLANRCRINNSMTFLMIGLTLIMIRSCTLETAKHAIG